MHYPEFEKLPPYRIAILNPYLQSGKKEIAETEAAMRMQVAGSRLGLTIEMIAKSEELEAFNPHFVIAHSYQDPKLTRYPTYGTLTMPPKWVQNVPRFKRNVLTYDAYITISESVIDFVNDITHQGGKEISHVYAAFSAPYTPYQDINLNKATTAYLGTNWDGKRHNDFFQYFSDTNYLRCYGPDKSWETAKKSNIYGGEVPFDGHSVYEVYRKNGIGLCINHASFDSAGIPSSRVFEIPASSALMISGHNQLVKNLFNDLALYVDSELPSCELAEMVKQQVEWVRSNTTKAKEMAREANRVFCKKLSLEIFLKNIVQHYENNFHSAPLHKPLTETKIDQNKQENIDVLLFVEQINQNTFNFVRDLSTQSLKPRALHIIQTEEADFDKITFAELKSILETSDIKVITNRVEELSETVKIKYIRNVITDPDLQWITLARNDDRYFKEHFQTCISALHQNNESNVKGNSKKTSIIYSAIVDEGDSASQPLPELFEDSYSIYRDEYLRIGYYTYLKSKTELAAAIDLHPGGILINTESLMNNDKEISDTRDLISLATEFGNLLFTGNVTCQRMVSNDETNRMSHLILER